MKSEQTLLAEWALTLWQIIYGCRVSVSTIRSRRVVPEFEEAEAWNRAISVHTRETARQASAEAQEATR